MNNKKLKLVGRYIFKNGRYYIFNGGSGFSFKMKGKSFKVFFNSSPKEGYYYIIVDRDYNNKVKVSTLNGDIYLFNSEGTHYVDIVKANETSDNVFELKDLEIDGELLDYDHQYDYRVKVYGDSTIAGYGILSHSDNPSIHNCDAVRDFCYHALYGSNADIDILSASGWGLVFSAYTCPKSIGIIDYVDKVGVYQHNKWSDKACDLLIVSLGTNDNSYIQENINQKDQLVDTFIAKYKALIEMHVEENKNLKILMVYGTLKEEDVYYLIEKTYAVLKPLFPNLFIHKFDGDNTAISYHAYVKAHETMAEELKKVIKEIMD